MKKVLSVIAAAVIVTLGAQASSVDPVTNIEKTGKLLRQQTLQCTQIFQRVTVLHTAKDIPTLVKTRSKLRRELLEMTRLAEILRERQSLQNYSDYLLSIEEGLKQMEMLAEEPVNKSVLEQVRNMCDFITTIDKQILENLGTTKTYQASR